MYKYCEATVAKSTASQYSRRFRRYSNFCRTLKIHKYTQRSICLFITHLASTITHQTLLAYVAAFKYFARNHISSKKLKSMYRLTNILAGIKRLTYVPSKKPPRLPILHKQLTILKKHLQESYSRKDRLMLWCACMFLFFGMLRISEIASATNNSFIKEREKKPYGITLITCNSTLVYIIDYLLGPVSGNFVVKMLLRW